MFISQGTDKLLFEAPITVTAEPLHALTRRGVQRSSPAYIGTQVVPVPIQTRFALLVFLLATGISCRPSDPLQPTPGLSHRPRGGPPVPAEAPSSAKPRQWARWAEVVSYRVAMPRAPSQHRAADSEAETLASSSADSYPNVGPSTSFPIGAVLVQRVFEIGALAPDEIFVMERLAPDQQFPAGQWEFLVLGPNGLTKDREANLFCIRCHAEAPHDGVFGRER